MKEKQPEMPLAVRAAEYLTGTMVETNAETFNIKLENFSINGEIKGDFLLSIKKLHAKD